VVGVFFDLVDVVFHLEDQVELEEGHQEDGAVYYKLCCLNHPFPLGWPDWALHVRRVGELVNCFLDVAVRNLSVETEIRIN